MNNPDSARIGLEPINILYFADIEFQNNVEIPICEHNFHHN